VLDLLNAPARQAATLGETAHRPWPPPERSWILGQTWDDLLFAHWRVPEEQLRAHVPEELALDTHEGEAWLGITPFRLTGLRGRGLLPLPVVSSFLELNVRTYVTCEDKPGIWFFSLDAESQLAVEAARRGYKLPYFRARMSAALREGWLDYSSARSDAKSARRVFNARYRAAGDVFNAEPGSLEWFLTERYCLYTVGERGRLCRAEIHHPPWPLQEAEAEIELNSMPPEGIELPDEEPLVHYSRRQDVVIWPLESVRGEARARSG
jgi:uncharacterized protein YqjF (DUF2071 family)